MESNWEKDRVKIGELFRIKRKELGLTIEDLAGTDISASTISNIERATHNVSKEMYEVYAKKLKINKWLTDYKEEVEKLERKAKTELSYIEDIIAAQPKIALRKLNELEEDMNLDQLIVIAPLVTYLKGWCYFELKNLKEARSHLETAIQMIDQAPESEQTKLAKSNVKAAALNDLGRVAYFENDIKQALQYTEQGINAFVPNGERIHCRHYLLLNKAVYLEVMNENEDALEAIEVLHRELRNDLHSRDSCSEILFPTKLEIVIQMYTMYAIVLVKLKMFKKALQYASKGVEIARINRSYDLLFTLRTTIGSIHLIKGDWEQAEKCYLMALSLRNIVKKKSLLLPAYTELGILYSQRQKWDQAHRAFDQALKIGQSMHYPLEYVDALVAKAYAYEKQTKYSLAIPLLKTAEKLARKYNNSNKLCNIFESLAFCLEKEGDLTGFEKYKNKLFSLYLCER